MGGGVIHPPTRHVRRFESTALRSPGFKKVLESLKSPRRNQPIYIYTGHSLPEGSKHFFTYDTQIGHFKYQYRKCSVGFH